MAKASLKLTGDWKKLRAALDGAKAEERLKREVGKATAMNAALAAAEMRKTIRGGVPPALAPLTRAIKRSSKPLVDRGDFWKAIVGVKVTWKRAEAGVLRTTPEEVNVGLLLHEGATVRVTPKMRAMFKRLAAVADGRWDAGKLTGRALDLWRRNPKMKWRPLGAGTVALKIPGRRWLQETLDKPELREQIRANWAAAVARAMTEG